LKNGRNSPQNPNMGRLDPVEQYHRPPRKHTALSDAPCNTLDNARPVHAAVAVRHGAAVVAAVAPQVEGGPAALAAPVGRKLANRNHGTRRTIGPGQHQPGHGPKDGDPGLLERLGKCIAQNLS